MCMCQYNAAICSAVYVFNILIHNNHLSLLILACAEQKEAEIGELRTKLRTAEERLHATNRGKHTLNP